MANADLSVPTSHTADNMSLLPPVILSACSPRSPENFILNIITNAHYHFFFDNSREKMVTCPYSYNI